MAEPSDLPLRFGRALRMIRTGRGLSQMGLAHEAGLSRTYIGEVERGNRCPSICTVELLARAVHMQPYELLKAADDAQIWLGSG